MRLRLLSMLAVSLLSWTPGALAGGAVTAFQPGKLPPEALPHLQVKAVVAEFLDPDKTELGKEIGYLVWREILTSISDQRGAGVIIAHPPGNERLVDLLRQSYHQAALRIAESQKARMAVWGSVAELDGRLAIDTYLSLVGDVVREELALRLNWSDSPGAALKDTGLSARITRTRFNFPRIWLTREQLFVRHLLVQVDTPVRDRPSREYGKVVVRARINESLWSESMEGEWFRVKTHNGAAGYVNAWDVYVPPRQVESLGKDALTSLPAVDAKKIGATAAGTKYPVLSSRYIDKVGLWYQIETPAGAGWVRAFRVRTHFSLPVVHFAAGLYRYQLGRYEEAAREFEQFTRLEGVQADPASLSTAYQLLGASQLMGVSKARKSVAGIALHDRALQQAIVITPYDPGAYTLRAVATLAARESAAGALTDVAKALEYDPGNRDARAMLDRLQLLSNREVAPVKGGPAVPPPVLFQQDFKGATGASLRRNIEQMSARYSGVPVTDAATSGQR